MDTIAQYGGCVNYLLDEGRYLRSFASTCTWCSICRRSRFIVGWLIAEKQSGDYAEQLVFGVHYTRRALMV